MHNKKAEANESISGVLMIPQSCVRMFAHKRCISAFPLTFLRPDLRRQRRRGCRGANYPADSCLLCLITVPSASAAHGAARPLLYSLHSLTSRSHLTWWSSLLVFLEWRISKLLFDQQYLMWMTRPGLSIQSFFFFNICSPTLFLSSLPDSLSINNAASKTRRHFYKGSVCATPLWM